MGLKETTQRIKLLVMDVDGTLTDGGIYMGDKGELFKRFNIKDGYAIRHMLPKMGIEPVILTGRESEIVNKRCVELGIKRIYQASRDKAVSLRQISEDLGINPQEMAYIGDDLNDFPAMQIAGICGCPADAVKEIQDICEFVSESNGGYGAVREFIEWIGNNR